MNSRYKSTLDWCTARQEQALALHTTTNMTSYRTDDQWSPLQLQSDIGFRGTSDDYHSY